MIQTHIAIIICTTDHRGCVIYGSPLRTRFALVRISLITNGLTTGGASNGRLGTFRQRARLTISLMREQRRWPRFLRQRTVANAGRAALTRPLLFTTHRDLQSAMAISPLLDLAQRGWNRFIIIFETKGSPGFRNCLYDAPRTKLAEQERFTTTGISPAITTPSSEISAK